MNFPDLPLIPWNTFISRVRIRWTSGSTPESFCNQDGKKQKMAKATKKPAAKPKAGKGGKGAMKDKC